MTSRAPISTARRYQSPIRDPRAETHGAGPRRPEDSPWLFLAVGAITVTMFTLTAAAVLKAVIAAAAVAVGR